MRDPVPLDPHADNDDENNRRLFGALAIVTVLVVAGTLAILGLAILGRSGEQPAGNRGLLTTPPPSEAPQHPALLRAVELRARPAPDTPLVAMLGVATEIRVLGRSSDGGWLMIGPSDRPEVIGWVPAHLVRGVSDLWGLSVINDPPPAPPATPTLTPDLPDLRILRAFSQDNQLWAEIGNEGAADAQVTLAVAVNGREPIPISPEPGERLEPGASYAAPIPHEYVQLRGPVTLVLHVDPPIEEESTDGKTWTGIVSPDQPNDIEIRAMTLAEPGGYVRVTVRNNSPIPVRGNITVTVREALPSTVLLGRQTTFVELPRNGTLDVEFHEIVRDRLDGLTAQLTTDAIEDAEIANNIYPR